MHHRCLLVALAACGACSNPKGGGGGTPDGGGVVVGDGGVVVEDGLSTTAGCGGVFNPDQVLTYELDMSAGDWSSLVADTSFTNYFPADLRCDDGAPIQVGVRHKRSGGTDKVGIKIDVNLYQDNDWFGLKKLSLENGTSTGDVESTVEGVVAEYLSWRVMVLAGPHAGRTALCRLVVNGELIGVYANVEQVDKRFLEVHFVDDSGWLYKRSGGEDDGYQTNEGESNPYGDYFCFWDGQCDAPGDLEATLPDKLDIEQMLRFGAANSLMGNTDGPIFKNNNYYFYDWDGGRMYLPWDLDTTMRQTTDLFAGGGGGTTTLYTDVLFSHWEADYDRILTDLLADQITPAAIAAELDRIETVAAAALSEDPNGGDPSGAIAQLRSWWEARLVDAQAQVDAH